MRRFIFALLVVLALASTAVASGPLKLTFDQSADCGFVSGWEIAYQPAATAGAQPSSTALGVSVPNTAPLVCGAGVATVQPFVGVGSNRFWIRAAAADGTKSAYSNSMDFAIPFAAPVLRSVGN